MSCIIDLDLLCLQYDTDWSYNSKSLYILISDSGDVKRDIGHILDFITRLKCLQVCC